MEDYGLALKKLREYFHLTQRELGERLGISNHAISKWENGVNQPDIPTLRALCAVYNITTEDFFRIAAGEDVNEVLRPPNPLSTNNKSVPCTSATQNITNSMGAGTSLTKSFFATHKLLFSCIIAALALIITVAVAFAIAQSFKNNLPSLNRPSNSASGSDIDTDSDISNDTASGSNDNSGDEDPPVRVIGHLDYYLDGRYYGCHDIVEGEKVTPLAAEKTGYVFLGWYTQETGGDFFDFDTFDFENMDKSYDLYARFRPIRYSVVFRCGYGGGTYTFSVKHQETWSFPVAIFERGGYTLIGWKTEKGVTYDLGAEGANLCLIDGGTVYFDAVWQWANPDAVCVRFINADGVAAEDQAQYVGVPFTLPASTVTKTGYKFGGYFYKGKNYQAGDTFTIAAEDVSDGEVLIAWWWEPISYTIHYEMTYQGTRYISTQEYFYSEWDTFAPKKAFNSVVANFDKVIGWVIDGKNYKPSSYVPEFLKVDGAEYHAEAVLDLSVNYTLKFVSGSEYAKGSMDNIRANSNTPATLPDCSFTFSNYIFIGWEYNGKIYHPGDTFPYIDGVTEYTLSAVWEGTPHVLKITSAKHTGQEFQIHVQYGYHLYFADLLKICEENGWDLTGLTLQGVITNGNLAQTEQLQYYSCLHGKEGETVVVEMIWEKFW